MENTACINVSADFFFFISMYHVCLCICVYYFFIINSIIQLFKRLKASDSMISIYQKKPTN